MPGQGLILGFTIELSLIIPPKILVMGTIKKNLKIKYNDYTVTFNREPQYLDVSGMEHPWPTYDLEDRRYLKFDLNMTRETAEDQSLLTENKRLFIEVLPEIGNGLNHELDMYKLYNYLK